MAGFATIAISHLLYSHLAVFRSHLPPLRERGNDVLLLGERFMRELGSLREPRHISRSCVSAQRCVSTRPTCVHTHTDPVLHCHLSLWEGATTLILGAPSRLHFGTADALRQSGGAGRVSRFARVSVIILGLGVVVILLLLMLELTAQRVHCVYSVVSVIGPIGQRLVCACISGVLSSCFEPFDQDPATARDHERLGRCRAGSLSQRSLSQEEAR